MLISADELKEFIITPAEMAEHKRIVLQILAEREAQELQAVNVRANKRKSAAERTAARDAYLKGYMDALGSYSKAAEQITKDIIAKYAAEEN